MAPPVSYLRKGGDAVLKKRKPEKSKTSERADRQKKGVSLSKTNLVLAIASLFISVILLITTFMVNNTHQKLETISNEHIEWQQVAIDMEFASNYLTEEARAFVGSGNKNNTKNIDNYFWEARENQRREKALEKIRVRYSEESEIYQSLKAAVDESVELMNTEYLAMRLHLNALDQDTEELLEKYPELRTADVSKYEAMSFRDKLDAASDLLNGSLYRDKKDRIEDSVNTCLEQLIRETSSAQDKVTKIMATILALQRIWIVLLIAVMLSMIITVMNQIIQPLRRAVPSIQNDEPLPVSGAAEFRLLARTYNRMYHINQAYREKLLFKANHDPLTGVLNRAGIEEMLKGADLSEAALLIVDVDHFKTFNDRFGHEVGDLVLSTVVRTLQELFRIEDVICRMGGDEFAIIMWHMEPDKKQLIAEKINRGNEKLSKGENDLPPITISVGVAFGAESVPEELFRNADRALYMAKEAGRSRCCFFEEGKTGEETTGAGVEGAPTESETN